MTDNKDLNQRFDKLEARLESLASSPDSRFPPLDSRFPAASRSDEIDLRELFAILWQRKWWVIGITFLFVAVGFIYVLNLPNVYRSEAVFAVTQHKAGGFASQYGELAAVAGLSLGGEGGNDVEQALALAVSWPFLDSLVERHKLKPKVMAAKGWDFKLEQYVWDTELYDPRAQEWKSSRDGISFEPSSFRTFERLSQSIVMNKDAKTGLVKISVETLSPVFSVEVLDLIVGELNLHFQRRDILDSTRSIEFLESKISETGIAEMQSVFYGMIENQTKKLMLAHSSGEHLLRTVVESKVPENKSGPARAVLAVIVFVCSSFISMLSVLGLVVYRRGCK